MMRGFFFLFKELLKGLSVKYFYTFLLTWLHFPTFSSLACEKKETQFFFCLWDSFFLATLLEMSTFFLALASNNNINSLKIWQSSSTFWRIQCSEEFTTVLVFSFKESVVYIRVEFCETVIFSSSLSPSSWWNLQWWSITWSSREREREQEEETMTEIVCWQHSQTWLIGNVRI